MKQAKRDSLNMHGDSHSLKGLMAKIQTDRKNEAKLKEMYASNRGAF